MRNEQQRAQETVRGLVSDLALIEQLEEIKRALQILDNKCAFFLEVYGRAHPEYIRVHAERDQLLLHADALVQNWINERQHLPAPKA